jgi:hypothetical protein
MIAAVTGGGLKKQHLPGYPVQLLLYSIVDCSLP